MPHAGDVERDDMSLQSVESAKNAMDQTVSELDSRKVALMGEMHAAKQAGVPVAAIARAAGVTRSTAIAWIKECEHAVK